MTAKRKTAPGPIKPPAPPPPMVDSADAQMAAMYPLFDKLENLRKEFADASSVCLRDVTEEVATIAYRLARRAEQAAKNLEQVEMGEAMMDGRDLLRSM